MNMFSFEDFRLLAERLLTFYLIPWDGNTDDKVRVLLTLYSNVSENAQRYVGND